MCVIEKLDYDSFLDSSQTSSFLRYFPFLSLSTTPKVALIDSCKHRWKVKGKKNKTMWSISLLPSTGECKYRQMEVAQLLHSYPERNAHQVSQLLFCGEVNISTPFMVVGWAGGWLLWLHELRSLGLISPIHFACTEECPGNCFSREEKIRTKESENKKEFREKRRRGRSRLYSIILFLSLLPPFSHSLL